MSKKRRQTILKWGLLLLLVGYSVWAVMWAGAEARRRVCTGVEVEVEGFSLSDSIIRHGVEEQLREYPHPIEGQPLYLLNTDAIRRYLASLRNFESVECMVSADGHLKVYVVPMVPVMRVFSAGKSYYVNKEGKQIDTDADFFADVPVVSGNFNRNFTPKAALPLVTFIADDPELKNLVSMIEARDAHNLLLVPRITGHVVNFGDTTRMAEKRALLLSFYHKVMPYKGWNHYDTISVKFKGQVVATRRDKTRLNHGEHYEEEIDLEEATLPEPHTENVANQNTTESNTPPA